MKRPKQTLKQLSLETIALSTARGRLTFFALISIIIFFMPPRWPVTFSIWQWLHIPSPSIGLTRAYRLVLHGDMAAAWQQNKLIFAVLIIGSFILIRDVLSVIKNRPQDNGR